MFKERTIGSVTVIRLNFHNHQTFFRFVAGIPSHRTSAVAWPKIPIFALFCRRRSCFSWLSWCHLQVTLLEQSFLLHHRNKQRGFSATKVSTLQLLFNFSQNKSISIHSVYETHPRDNLHFFHQLTFLPPILYPTGGEKKEASLACFQFFSHLLLESWRELIFQETWRYVWFFGLWLCEPIQTWNFHIFPSRIQQ